MQGFTVRSLIKTALSGGSGFPFPGIVRKILKTGDIFQKSSQMPLHFVTKYAILHMLKECKFGVDRKVRSFL